METSAKNGNNIEKLFGLTAKMIYEQYSEEQKISSVKFFLFFQTIDKEIIDDLKSENVEDSKSKCCNLY